MDEAMDYAPLAKPVVPPVDAPADGEVSEWIRSIGGGGKLSKRLIEQIEDSYDHLRQISENYRLGGSKCSNWGPFLSQLPL
jgi:hypothetical protein